MQHLSPQQRGHQSTPSATLADHLQPCLALQKLILRIFKSPQICTTTVYEYLIYYKLEQQRIFHHGKTRIDMLMIETISVIEL